MDDDFEGKFKLESVKEYLRKRKTIINISPAIIFLNLSKERLKLLLSSHLMCC